MTNLDVKAKAFEIYNNTIYYYDGTSYSIKKCGLNGKNVSTLVSSVEITDLYVNDGVLYYTSVKSGKTGFYSYDIATNKETKITDKYAHGISAYDGKIYFINSYVTYSADYPGHMSKDCDGSVYCYDGKTVTKIA